MTVSVPGGLHPAQINSFVIPAKETFFNVDADPGSPRCGVREGPSMRSVRSTLYGAYGASFAGPRIFLAAETRLVVRGDDRELNCPGLAPVDSGMDCR